MRNKGKRGAALVFTTEPAFAEFANSTDRQQLDVLTVLEADNADTYGERAAALAEFVTAALNTYIDTHDGSIHWQRVHPLMAEMRAAGRQ